MLGCLKGLRGFVPRFQSSVVFCNLCNFMYRGFIFQLFSSGVEVMVPEVHEPSVISNNLKNPPAPACQGHQGQFGF